jgi:hypothetical protein
MKTKNTTTNLSTVPLMNVSFYKSIPVQFEGQVTGILKHFPKAKMG